MDRARTLLLFASGMPRPRRVFADTVRHFVPSGIARLAARAPFRYLRAIFTDEYESLSYAVDWRDAFVASDRLDVVTCNVNDAFALATAGRRIREFDLVVALHSAAGDSLSQVQRFASDLSRRRDDQ